MYAPKINAPITNRAMRINIVFCRLSIKHTTFGTQREVLGSLYTISHILYNWYFPDRKSVV